jgi:MerR family transcriptional regulator, copper efflux regulator
MDGYSIFQVAERAGFAPTTLRFYEQSGLVRPARTPAGYRSYDDTHIESLSFIGRAKRLGLSLDEIAELLALLDDDECAPVQGRLRALVEANMAQARSKAAELEGFAAELDRVLTTLGTHTPAGPCDDTCGCTTDHPGSDRPVASAPHSVPDGGPAVACALPSGEITDRLDEWSATVAAATGREAIDGGTRLTFGRDVEVASLVALVTAERDCCGFLTFTLTVASSGVTLDITGPADARPVIEALVATVG